jgi:SAM-dependent methyltransferase
MTYKHSARFYDLFGSKNDLEFYRRLALRSGRNALELGVGTGRLAIPLAKAGITVVGIDNSVHMLDVAGEKLAKESKAVRKLVILRSGDMRNFELEQVFPFIYIPSSTFDHNTTAKEQEKALSCIYKHLEKGGTLAFDLEQLTADKPDSSWWIDRKETDEGRMVVRSIFSRRDKKRCTCTLDLFFDIYKNGKMLERFYEYGEVAMISKDNITELLHKSGFRIRDIYGDFDQAKYRKDSPRMVIVACRR